MVRDKFPPCETDEFTILFFRTEAILPTLAQAPGSPACDKSGAPAMHNNVRPSQTSVLWEGRRETRAIVNSGTRAATPSDANNA